MEITTTYKDSMYKNVRDAPELVSVTPLEGDVDFDYRVELVAYVKAHSPDGAVQKARKTAKSVSEQIHDVMLIVRSWKG